MQTTDNGDGTYTHTLTGGDFVEAIAALMRDYHPGRRFGEGVTNGLYRWEQRLLMIRREQLHAHVMRVCAGQRRRQTRARHRPA